MGYIFPSIKGTRCRSKTSPGISSGGGRFRFLGDQRHWGPNNEHSSICCICLNKLEGQWNKKNVYIRKNQQKKLGIFVHTPLKNSVTIISTYFISTLPPLKTCSEQKMHLRAPKTILMPRCSISQPALYLDNGSRRTYGCIGKGLKVEG